MTDTPSALRRMFGPDEHELTCDECFELLDSYVDLEAAGADAGRAMPGMQPHLLGCPACADEHDALLELIRDDGQPRR